MRLVKIGLASVNTTVGATHANVERALRFAQEMAAAERDGRRLPGADGRRIPARGPHPVGWLRRGPVAGARALRPGRRASSPPCTCSGWRWSHQGLRYNCAAVVAGGRDPRPGPQGEAAHLQHLLRGPHLRPRLPLPACRAPGRAVRRPDLPLRLRGHRPGGLRGRLDGRVPDAPSRVLRRGAGGEHLGLGVPGGDRRDAARDAHHPRRGPPVHAGLREPRRRQRRAALRRRRASCSRTASRCSMRRAGARAGRRPRSTSTARCACASENTTWRQDHAAWATSHEAVPTVDIPEERVPHPPRDAEPIRCRRTEASSSPAPRSTSRRAPATARTCSTRWRWASATTSRRTASSRPSAWRCRAGATRCSPCSSPTAGRRGRSRRRREACSAPSSCRAATPQPRRRRRRAPSCDELGVPLRVVSIDEAFERELEAVRAMLQPGESVTPLTEQNIQARLRGAADVELEQLVRRAVPPDREHEREGGRLHHDRRRPRGRAGGHRQRAEDGGDGPARLPPGGPPLEGIRLVLQKPPGPELAPNQVGEEELMPFPVLDACFHLFAGEKLLPDEVEQIAGRDVPRACAKDTVHGLRHPVRAAVPHQHLQVGAGAAVAAHRQPGPRSRARAAAARWSPAPSGR